MSLEWRGGAPFGMQRRQRLDPIECERELKIHRLLGPQGAVVVEHGDALPGREIVGAAFACDPSDEFNDRVLAGSLRPRCQRIGECGRGRGDQ
jgi:hypothetical protein